MHDKFFDVDNFLVLLIAFIYDNVMLIMIMLRLLFDIESIRIRLWPKIIFHEIIETLFENGSYISSASIGRRGNQRLGLSMVEIRGYVCPFFRAVLSTGPQLSPAPYYVTQLLNCL